MTIWAPGKPLMTASARLSAFLTPMGAQCRSFCCISRAMMPGGAGAMSRSLRPGWKPERRSRCLCMPQVARGLEGRSAKKALAMSSRPVIRPNLVAACLAGKVRRLLPQTRG